MALAVDTLLAAIRTARALHLDCRHIVVKLLSSATVQIDYPLC